MQNLTAKKLPELVSQATLLAIGAEENATLDLGSNTAANIRLDIAGLTTAIANYGTADDELTTKGDLVRGLSRESRALLMAARDSFKPLLGYRHNQGWDSTGLLRSLKVPGSELKLLPLLGSFKTYLAGKPLMEVPSKEITVVRFGQMYDTLENAIAERNAQDTITQNMLRARDAQVKRLRSRIRGTIAALTQALDPLDARWSSFGLNQPGRKARPDQPGKISITLSNGSASLKWQRAAHAEYYRVWLRRVGLDAEALPVGSPADLNFTLDPLPPGTQIEVSLTAMNNGGESARSEVVALTIV